jgi:TP901-1 family phage major tail protein
MAVALPNGSAILFSVEDPEDPGTFITIGCQRDGSWDENQSTIDVSCKDSRAMEIEAGRYSGSLSVDIVYDPEDPAYLICRDAVRNGDKTKFTRVENGTAIEEVDAVITSLSHAAPDQDAAIVSLSADTDGIWVAVPEGP